MDKSKKTPLSIEEFEKIIVDNLSPEIKSLLKSPHKYSVMFGTYHQNPGYSEYYLEIFRVKKLSVPNSQILNHKQRIKYIYKEEQTDNLLMKCLECKYPKHRSLPNQTGYYSTIFKSPIDNRYYFKGTALYWTFNLCSSDLTAENAIKIGKSIYIDY